MGYTHYWRTITAGISQDKWNGFIKDFETILPEFIKLLDTTADQKLTYDGDGIFFNGVGENAFETFHIERNPEQSVHTEDRDRVFDCCKTGHQEYDIAVCSVLIIAKRHFGDDIHVSSDGDNADEEWQVAKALCQKVLGYGNLDMGDVYQDTDGKYKVRNPDTLGKFIDEVAEPQKPKVDQDAIRQILVDLAKSELSINDAVEKINQEIVTQ